MSKVQIRSLEIVPSPLTSPLINGGRIFQETGELTQIINGSFFQFLAYIEFSNKTLIPRGNHYHKVKDEFLYIIKGRLKAMFYDIDTHEREERLIEAGNLVNVQPRCAHVYIPLEYTQCVEFSSSTFDPNDIYKYDFQI